ncbi:MAG: hypothetical protein FJ255_05035 [Phycisphaerae bacterium]|nr:hypothetical protein [Phycisphaerae bacterium]
MSAPRTRLGLAALAVAGASLASVVLVNALAPRLGVRIDVTATGEHRLAPRTRAILASIDRPVRIVIATDFSTVDPRARQRVEDVLDQVRRAHPRVSTAMIDVGSPAGLPEFKGVVRGLASAWKGPIDRRTGQLRAASDAVSALASALESTVAPSLAALREAATGTDDAAMDLRRYLESRGTEARLVARELRGAIAQSQERLAAQVAGSALPRLGEARDALLPPADQALSRLDGLSRDLSRLSPSVAEGVRQSARALETLVRQARDASAVALDPVRRAAPLEIERVVGALQAGSCVLIVAEPDPRWGRPEAGPTENGARGGAIAGIEPTELFPPGEWLDAAGLARADVRRRAEELLATALASLDTPHRPILVLTHAERGSVLPLFGAVQDRLRLRGMDLAEWRVLQSPDAAPALSDLNPGGRRPVVYVSIAPDSAAGTGPGGEPTGAVRAGMLGAALALVAERGDPVILSMNPSILPGTGQPDPTVAVLSRFGLEAHTGAPIVEEEQTPQGRAIRTEFAVRPAAGEHPISGAVANLATALVWPVAIAAAPGPTAASHSVIASLAASERAWGESQWLRVWQTPAAQRPLMRDPPRFDQGRDTRLDAYPVIVAASRPLPDGGEQRLIAVGTNAWLVDPVIRQSATIDGRTVDVFPGNLELLEAGLAWLTGQERLIARSATAQATPLVRELDPGTLFWLRVGVIAGMPGGTLVLLLLARALRR